MKIVKTCDLSGEVAARLFSMLNLGIVRFDRNLLFTDVEPKDLNYPEGWYYAKGCFRNKYNSSTGAYSEITMLTYKQEMWGELAKYSTLDMTAENLTDIFESGDITIFTTITSNN